MTRLSDFPKEETVNSHIVIADLMAKAEVSVNNAHNILSLLACKERELKM